jgi:hypothetical protein
MFAVLLTLLGLGELASLRWGVDTRDSLDWRFDDRLG